MRKILTLVVLLTCVSKAFAADIDEFAARGMPYELATELDQAYSTARTQSVVPNTNSDIDLGTAAKSFEDLFVEKILADNDSTSDLDADVTTATTAKPLVSVVGTSATQAHAALVQNVASAQGADLFAIKTRAAAGATNANTIVASGDDILKIRGFAADGAAYSEAAQILLEVGGTPGTDDMPGQIRFLVSADGGETPAEALKIAPDLTVTFAGTLIGTGTSTIGWAVVAGANTACTTTCTTPCVFGVNTAATEADIVACADATADECLCAGAS
jgi:hypothetical protein